MMLHKDLVRDLADCVLNPIQLPCGGIAYFDKESGISFRCIDCFATVGSIGMPRHCKEEADKWEVQKALGGAGWDYEYKGDGQDEW